MSKIDVNEDKKVVKMLVRKLHFQAAILAIMAAMLTGMAKGNAPEWQLAVVGGAFFIYLFEMHHIATGAVRMHGEILVSLAEYLTRYGDDKKEKS